MSFVVSYFLMATFMQRVPTEGCFLYAIQTKMNGRMRGSHALLVGEAAASVMVDIFT